MELSTHNFDFHVALQQAERILAAPPAREFIRRPTLLPHIVFRAAVPAELCLEANKNVSMGFKPKAKFIQAGISQKLWKHLEGQALLWARYRFAWPLDLDGRRPQVVAIKFSSRAPDVGSNPAKKLIDMLTCDKWINRAEGNLTKYRLGLIRDDRPECVEQVHGWEFLPAKHTAFILLEVRV